MPREFGMLFIFPELGRQSFWMKDMLFPIDIIWVDADKKVVGIASDVLPETYPETFAPPSEIKYVLELNSGGAASYGIATGTQLVF